MSERKTFYEVGEFYNNHLPGTHCKIVEKIATVENGIARFVTHPNLGIEEVALASSLCWSPEEACALHQAEQQLKVARLRKDLEEAEKALKQSEGLHARWLKDQEAERREKEHRLERERERHERERQNMRLANGDK